MGKKKSLLLGGGTTTAGVEDDRPIAELSTSKSSASSSSPLYNIKKNLKILYKFSRPHTIKGTILASSMGVTRALMEHPRSLNLQLVPRAIIGLIALLCGNAYIVGINQIYDVKIDEINKPFLPIAAKVLSEQRAWVLVLTSLFSGISIVRSQFSPVIFRLYLLGVLLGTVYSVPPVQLKRFPLCAGSIIAIVRGFLLNFGVYYAVREALQIPFQWNPVVVFIASFMTIFASTIAITKDLPDVEGDKKYQISTFASKYGVQAIAKAACSVLGCAYLGAIGLPYLFPTNFRLLPMLLGHLGGLVYLVYLYKQLNANDASSVKAFYKRIWNLFYFEYLLYPFI
eukprot:scaffold1534_cov158-Ochromonas_danica.AAC.5